MSDIIRPFLEPTSVAVIGVPRATGPDTYNIVENMLNAGFSGTIYPINPRADEILGIKAYSSILAIDGEIDLAVIMIARAEVPRVVWECVQKGVKAITIVTQDHPDDFYAGSSSSTEVYRRDVAHVGTPVKGQSLCRNGMTSHKDCQEVRKLNVCSGGACNLVQMGKHMSDDGDSGGPVYWNYTVYGIHRGWMYDPCWPFDREIFSRADRIHYALGVAIALD